MRWMVLLVSTVLTSAGVLEAQSRPLDSAAVAALRRVLQLPRTTAEAREAGVADSLIRIVLGEARRRGVPAGDAQEAVEAETEAVRAGAPKDNFGAFVQAQLAAGKRGRELAAAIRAEHARLGHGRGGAMAGAADRAPPPATGKPKGGPGVKGKPDTTERGRADSAARKRGGSQ